MSASDREIKHYSQPWTKKQLGHLLARTLFGVTQEDLEFFKGKTMDQCVEILLRTMPTPPLPTYRTKDDPVDVVSDGTSLVFAPENKERDEDWTLYIKAWWVGLMLNPQRSIIEKMVLFWHNHFVIEFNTVKDSRYDYQYLNVLRKHATGDFKKLLREITTTPGMLVYLNGNLNSKDASNENYGRELQELFTIGKGPDSHFTESDVKAAAKVLTGWKDDKNNISSYFDPTSHNTEDKVFSAFYSNYKIKGRSGETGAEETDDLIEMICSNAETSKFLCRKLYRWFVHSAIDEQVEKNVITPLSKILLQSNYDVKLVLKVMFTSSFFYAPKLIGATFKSPCDFFIGLLRETNVRVSNNFEGWYLISEALIAMGQNIGNPTNVAGWPAYWEFPSYDKNWVNSEFLSARSSILKLFSYYEPEGFNVRPNPLLEFDFTIFVSRLSNPADPKVVVSDSVNLLCIAAQPGENQISYIQGFLDTSNGKPWGELWASFRVNPTDEKIKEEINSRLRKVFNIILLLPEYQIM